MLVDCFQKASRMELVILQHCLLDANMVAHNLSKVAYETKVNIFWDGRPPDFIIADVIRDVTLLEVVTIS
jgi:hypothetical protein